jgi:hypothetical protein
MCLADPLAECTVRPIPLLAAALFAACTGHAPASSPAPQPAALPAPLPREEPRPTDAGIVADSMHTCVVRNGTLAEVTIQYDTGTGDTLYGGARFAEAFPTGPEYAEGAEWYATNEPIPFRGGLLVKYGYPRVLGVNEVTRIGEHRGVGLYAQAGRGKDVEVLYVPVRPGCVFQVFQIDV